MKIAGAAGIASLFSSSASAQRGEEPTFVDRRGPVRKSRFVVEIADVQVPGWQSVEMPPTRIAKAEYRQGTNPNRTASCGGGATTTRS